MPFSNPIFMLLGDETDKKRMGALLRVISVLILKLRGEDIKDVKPIADKYVDDARLFLRSLGTDPKLFNNMYGLILRKPAMVYPAALEFVKNLRAKLRETNLMNNLDKVSVHHKELLTPLLTLISTPESPSAYSSLLRRVSYLKEPDIQARFIKNFTETKDNSQTIYEQIAALVKTATGRKDSIALTTEENKEFKAGTAKQQDLASQISKLRSAYSEAVNQEMKQVILDSGKETQPVAAVLKALADAGVKKMPFPEEFRKSKHIYVNMNAELCDVQGNPLTLQRVQPGFGVSFNAGYDPAAAKDSGNTWIYKWTNPENGNTGYVYTKDRAATNKSEKFSKLSDVISTGDLEKKKASWRKRMGMDYDDPDTVFAYLTEYIYATSSRIGSGAGGNTGGKTTYGASNFLVKSVSLPTNGAAAPPKLKVAYLVKGGHKETFVLDPAKGDLDDKDKAALKKLIRFLVAKCEGKKPADRVFTMGSKSVNTTAYNAWLKGKCDLTPHNFRTLRGTELALKYLPDAAKKIDALRKKVAKGKRLADKVIDQTFLEAMTKVGKALGHIRRGADGKEESTANTSIAYYCAPSVMVDWYKEVGKAPPSAVIRAASNAKLDL